ncbi:MAG: trigger factor [Phycisphaerae bacterium]|nr:trigger factor [Phycisphaerae bacterium]
MGLERRLSIMTTATPHPYDITVESAGPARKRVNITVPTEAVASKLQDSMGMLRTQTAIPGFRKGKVPAHIIEKRFGESLRTEARNEIVSDAWKNAIEEFELRPLGEPEPVGDPEEVVLEEGKPLSFALEVEVMPEFELPAFDDIKLTRPMVEVNDEHIDEEIERQKIRNGTLQEVEGKAAEGDFVIGPAVVHLNSKEEPFYTTEQTRLTVPAKDAGGEILGLFIDDLGKILTGAGVGDEIVINTDGPEEHELEEVRGAKVEVTFNVIQAVKINPIEDDELVALFGLENADMLKEQVKLALEQRRDQDQAAVLRQQATAEIANRVEMELPEKTSAMQADRDLQRLRTQLQSSGKMSMEEVEAEVAKVRAGSADESQKRLKSFFILTKLAEHFHVTVNEMEVNARISELAMQNGKRPEEMRNTLAKQGQLQQIQAVVREEKAADQLVAACTITEMPVKEWQAKQDGGAVKKTTKKKTTKKKTAKKTATKKKTTKKTTKKSSSKS